MKKQPYDSTLHRDKFGRGQSIRGMCEPVVPYCSRTSAAAFAPLPIEDAFAGAQIRRIAELACTEIDARVRLRATSIAGKVLDEACQTTIDAVERIIRLRVAILAEQTFASKPADRDAVRIAPSA